MRMGFRSFYKRGGSDLDIGIILEYPILVFLMKIGFLEVLF